ncbi:hypothetical protein [Gordonia neofelifaecis]|uniref:Secreted protein n=1 Tax=Gordonia neofelifaecis NRRL B-59395 TaxID=644548 RepID=F1YFX0_9ACTN|nr:hypothetical protein [Gordonia neofelifaecis]EGD56547.1 hypothetical protein SCNU_03312 [Gordonia neofelifaecis NRRL B-59395]
MSRSAATRLVLAATVSALIASGAAAVAPQTIGAANAASCDPASRATKSAPAGVTHSYSKAVKETAGALAKVTYQIDIGTSGIGNPYVHSITDTPPSGFGKPTAKVTAFHLAGGLKEETVPVVADGTGWKVANSGWFVNSSNPVKASFTYDMPLSSIPGLPVTSGGITVTGTVGVGASLPDLKACFLTRVMTPGEAIGSIGDDLSSSGSTHSIISDVVSGVVSGILSGAGS